MGNDKNPFVSGLLSKMWETFVEKFLVPIVMTAIMGGFALYQQRVDQATVDRVYQQVAEKLNKELPANLETMRKQINVQNEEVGRLRTAVLELHLRHQIEKELSERGRVRKPPRVRTPPRARPTGVDGGADSVFRPNRPVAASPPPPPKPSEEPFRVLNRPPPQRMAPLPQVKLPARIKH